MKNRNLVRRKNHCVVQNSATLGEDFGVSRVFFTGQVKTLLVERTGDNRPNLALKSKVDRFVKALAGDCPTPRVNFSPRKPRQINFCSLKDIHLVGKPERFGGLRDHTQANGIFACKGPGDGLGTRNNDRPACLAKIRPASNKYLRTDPGRVTRSEGNQRPGIGGQSW